MGQKVNPMGMRVGIIRSRPCERYAKTKRQGADFAVEDIEIRKFVEKNLPNSGISKLIIRKTDKEGVLLIFSSKIGVIMGKQGNKLKEFEKKLKRKFKKSFTVNVKEVRAPELSAKIMGEYISQQLENRMPYRKVAKTVLQKVMDKGADGVKVQIGGRLNGTDIARREKFIDGRVSLQTFRSDIDYYYLQANTKYGVLGVKVRIQKGNIFKKSSNKSIDKQKAMKKI